jgi:hypothetical protein
MPNANINQQTREAWINEAPRARINQVIREAWIPLNVTNLGIIAETQIDAYPSGGTSSFVRFRLRNFAGSVPQAILPASALVTITGTLSAGSISQSLIPNSAIIPGGTFYTIELWSNGRITSSANVTITASGDLSTLL